MGALQTWWSGFKGVDPDNSMSATKCYEYLMTLGSLRDLDKCSKVSCVQPKHITISKSHCASFSDVAINNTMAQFKSYGATKSPAMAHAVYSITVCCGIIGNLNYSFQTMLVKV